MARLFQIRSAPTFGRGQGTAQVPAHGPGRTSREDKASYAKRRPPPGRPPHHEHAPHRSAPASNGVPCPGMITVANGSRSSRLFFRAAGPWRAGRSPVRPRSPGMSTDVYLAGRCGGRRCPPRCAREWAAAGPTGEQHAVRPCPSSGLPRTPPSGRGSARRETGRVDRVIRVMVTETMSVTPDGSKPYQPRAASSPERDATMPGSTTIAAGESTIRVTVPLTRPSSPSSPTYPSWSTWTWAEPVAGISCTVTPPTLQTCPAERERNSRNKHAPHAAQAPIKKSLNPGSS